MRRIDRENLKRNFNFLVIFFVVMIVYGIASLVYEWILNATVHFPRIVIVTLGVSAQVAICTMGIFWAAKQENHSLKNYGITWRKGEWRKLLLGLFIGALLILLISSPLYLTGVYRLTMGAADSEWMVTKFLFFTGVAIIEEFLCRGFLFHYFLSGGIVRALLCSSFLFSLLHLGNPGFTALAFINLFLAGLLMGLVMYVTDSLFAAVGVHITWNWVQGILLGIPVSGTDSIGFFSTKGTNHSDILTGGMFGLEGSIVCTIGLFLFAVGLILIGVNRRGNHLFKM